MGTLSALLQLRDEFSPALRHATANLQQTGATVQQVGGHISAAGVAIGAALGTLAANAVMSASSRLVQFGKDAILTAARTESLAAVAHFLGQRTGYTRQHIDALTATLNRQGITMQESSNVVIQLSRANLGLENATTVAAAAQNAAFISGMNSSQALGTILHGIVTLQPEVIRTAGITVNLEQAYREFSKTTGQTVESLSGQQKQQIALNEVLREAEKINGTYELSMQFVGKQLTSLPRHYEDASNAIGTQFLPLLRLVISGMTEFLGIAREHPATMTVLAGALLTLAGAAGIAASGVIGMTAGWAALGTGLVAGVGLMLNVVEKTRDMAMGYTNAEMAEAAWAKANHRTVDSLTATERQSIQTASRLETVFAVISELAARWSQLDFWRNSRMDVSDMPRVPVPKLALPSTGIGDPGGLALWEQSLRATAASAEALAWKTAQVAEAETIARQATNMYGEELRNADAAQLEFERSARQLHTTMLLMPTAITDNAASLDAYDLIATSSVITTGEWARAQREANEELARSGMLLDFAAHVSNNASQAVIEHAGTWKGLGSSLKQSIADVWKGMSGGGGIAGVFKNLGDSLVQGFGNLISGGLTQLINMGLNLATEGIKKLVHKFRGGEEALHVNPARDTFLSQFGDPSDKGVGGGGHTLAARLAQLGAGDGGGPLFAALQAADTMAEFQQAMADIREFIRMKGGGTVLTPDELTERERRRSVGLPDAPTSTRRRDQGNEWRSVGMPVTRPEPIPMALGGRGRVTSPTLFLAGEAGPEDVAFSGAGRSFGRARGGDTYNFTIHALDGASVEAAVPRILQCIAENRNGSYSDFEGLVTEVRRSNTSPGWRPRAR